MGNQKQDLDWAARYEATMQVEGLPVIAVFTCVNGWDLRAPPAELVEFDLTNILTSVVLTGSRLDMWRKGLDPFDEEQRNRSLAGTSVLGLRILAGGSLDALVRSEDLGPRGMGRYRKFRIICRDEGSHSPSELLVDSQQVLFEQIAS